MKGFTISLEQETRANSNFRKVLYTSKHCQLVLMCLQPSEDIGEEIHDYHDQFFRIESGEAKCVIDGHEFQLRSGDALIVPAGSKHNVINSSKVVTLKLYTIYSPAKHKDGIIRKTKQEALLDAPVFEGTFSE